MSGTSDYYSLFSDYLTKVRVSRAKELLMEGRSVEDVSECVGYRDGNYFIKIFQIISKFYT